MITLKPNFFKMKISCIWICFLKTYLGLLQYMKRVRCLEIVSNPAFLEHIFLLFDSSLSYGPLGVKMIHYEPRAYVLMTPSTASKNSFEI